MDGQEDKEYLFTLVSLIQGDIEGVLSAGQQEAIKKGVRHRAALEAIAQESSLAINQILGKAKREFGLGGLEPETPVDAATQKTLSAEIEAIDASYSLSTIVDLLAEELGIDFVSETRRKLEARVLEELAKATRSVEALQRALSQEIEAAQTYAENKIENRELRRMVSEDLDTLRRYYLDPEFLSAKLRQAR